MPWLRHEITPNVALIQQQCWSLCQVSLSCFRPMRNIRNGCYILRLNSYWLPQPLVISNTKWICPLHFNLRTSYYNPCGIFIPISRASRRESLWLCWCDRQPPHRSQLGIRIMHREQKMVWRDFCVWKERSWRRQRQNLNILEDSGSCLYSVTWGVWLDRDPRFEVVNMECGLEHLS